MTERDRLWRRLLPITAGIALLFAYGTVGYVILGFGVLDAFYKTVLAVTTLGIPEGQGFGPAEKIFTASLALLGVTAFLAAVAMLAAALIEGRFSEKARRRRMERRIEGLRDHFIVCAYGRVGQAVARELEHEDAPFLVIDRKPELQDDMERDGVLYMIEDPTSEEILRLAGVERARGLLCAVDSDAENLFITLIGRSLNPRMFIVARAAHRESVDRLRRAGANRVISPYASSGREMALQAVRPHLVGSLELSARGNDRVRLDEIAVDEGSDLDGRAIGEACRSAVPVVLRRSDGTVLSNPGADEVLRAGDVIMLVGDPSTLRSVEA
ncbi:MAG TPA: NAD-binding protein [Actinomycetota bacterium]|nr:NAD-binding protein [Actinomycetota bacterium]